ncbi:MAG TPA: hypothetical protein VK175_06330 [Leadbetterella sp.]|nr:hypothetical protein [Leadbetterella sp.]
MNESALDPYYRYYLKEIEFDDLTSMQQEKLERYMKIWSWYCMGRTKEVILSTIMRDYAVESRQAQYDLAETIALHGRLDQVQKDGLRVASREFHYLLAQFAMKDKQWDVAMRARKEGDVLAGIYDTEDMGWDPTVWNKPVKEVWAVQVINNNFNAPAGDEATQTIDIDE